jgi:hypothetical protein
MLNVIHAKCQLSECRDKVHYGECHYARCRYAECHGAGSTLPL